MNIYDLIVPLGILTYLTAFITLISGIKRMKLEKHKLLALITIILATIHAGLVIYINYF